MKRGGELNAQYPGGLDALRQRLEVEGHKITRRPHRTFVVGFETCLAKLKS